jgi:hypothetical protein
MLAVMVANSHAGLAKADGNQARTRSIVPIAKNAAPAQPSSVQAVFPPLDALIERWGAGVGFPPTMIRGAAIILSAR